MNRVEYLSIIKYHNLIDSMNKEEKELNLRREQLSSQIRRQKRSDLLTQKRKNYQSIRSGAGANDNSLTSHLEFE